MSQRLLLDTHTLLWLSAGAAELSPAARAAAVDPDNDKFFSVASLWEVAIKHGLGKLRLHLSFSELLAEIEGQSALRRLPVGNDHLLRFVTLPLHHRDPFDRMLVAQSLAEDFTLVSKDPMMDAYGVRRLW